mgnify:CR=1 FL=1
MEIAKVKLLVKAKAEENALGKSTTEDKLALAQLQAELINLETGDDKMKLFKDLRAKAEGSFGVIKQICRTLP